MDIRKLTPDLSVSPQITPEDAPAIAAAGFRTVICNRPDAENPPPLHAEHLRAAVEAAGMTFLHLPFDGSTMTAEVIVELRDMIATAQTPVLAYCRTGTRCTNAWALGQAGETPASDIMTAAAQAGYDVSGLAPYLSQKITL
ncbi:TIGR01244 family sulfur transferase [Rhodobacteraceae bacterium D3-12]|nr:TIGR01244 family sulfur transferase [Rhodobacteraceae bacterium D3-12]